MYYAMNTRFLHAATLAGMCALGLSGPSMAQSPFDDVVTAEILPGWETSEGTHMAGLRLVLADGWKTYWRAPGAAGIPPQFDWTGSANIQGVAVHWPRPDVFYQNGMRSIGYANEVVLPLEITRTETDTEITMNALVNLGVCLDVCVPATVQITAELPAKPQTAPIQAALDALPQTAALAGVGDVTCTAEAIEDGMRLTTSIPVSQIGSSEIVVVEAADPTIWVAETTVVRSGLSLTAVTDLVPEAAQPFEVDAETLRITVLAQDQAIDITGCALN